MAYNEEELLQLLDQIIKKSVSYESTSVTYDRAQELMDGILYHLEECSQEEGALQGENTPIEVLYQQGKELTKEKVYRAKALCQKITEVFQDYGVANYRDAIMKGMPAFFVRYDPIYMPQNHLLTLDYPVLFPRSEQRGVDLILDYLECIRAEQNFLKHFPENAVIQVLEETGKNYRQDYFDNIASRVLRQALFCMIAGKSLLYLEVDGEDQEEVKAFFAGETREKALIKITRLIEMLEQRLNLREGYFQAYGTEFYHLNISG